MRKIRIGQMGIGHNHGSGKMQAFRKFPERFEVVGYAEEDATWRDLRGDWPCYSDLPRMSPSELLEKCDAVAVECAVPDLTRCARFCVDAGKHIHLDKPGQRHAGGIWRHAGERAGKTAGGADGLYVPL